MFPWNLVDPGNIPKPTQKAWICDDCDVTWHDEGEGVCWSCERQLNPKD